MKTLIHKKFLRHPSCVVPVLFCFMIVTNCTFGSVGNSQEEEAIILESLIRTSRAVPSGFNPFLHAYDNQIDDNLQNFTILSNVGGNYNIQMKTNLNFLILNRIDFRFNPGDKIGGVFNVRSDTSKTHTPYTVPLDLPSDDPYGKIYSSSTKRIDGYSSKNSDGIGFGSVFRANLNPLINPPQGILSSTIAYFDRLDLYATIIRSNDSSQREVVISLRNIAVSFPPRCRIELTSSQTQEWILGLRYSNLFRDIIEPGQNVSVVNSLFQGSNSGDTIIISDLDSRYSYIQTNFTKEDNVLLQESCL
ncbi:hypothetical protein [Leptospira sp. GIMC2001]|uniref:hypothetical protein n=1 Tax=Leptospira sp. GIMC2001 TaxID=1513297 RepID=UPI00234B5F17|nr:hypothetical protein [Leptospira sp. GIMC2001]WCL49207.1 hypothetical protein O4O04_18225 [Leptospira sp. GIMC2001]